MVIAAQERGLDAHRLGLGDASAYRSYICGASYPTYLTTHWSRDRQRGPKLGLEFLVHAQTNATPSA